ncbi:glycosyl transferase family 2 [Scytonema hofmannii PCC 7110]|uniref:Glycosyl transferase family 2 n=1 Tax=Scytonema hofmannii PCC 7110 TaxID=128403 RepID=A0A139X3P6_9CYAN|nr:glycosyltransferase [Scytonema hofmannii]KYC39327.1 glycosyl transferase family 2 [Scytonema hofmannii PCC 7110]
MQVISRVRFPQTVETSDLYFNVDKSRSLDFHASESHITLRKSSTLSFNTYFNSIYEKLYTKYTSLSLLYYLLKLEGDFEVFAYRETEANTKEILFHNKFEQCQLSDPVKILLPELKHNQESGRIYLEITCFSEKGLFAEGLVVTEQEKPRDISLAIITCTFKKEVYVKKTVNTILQDRFLQDKKFKIFVVDNGKSLSHSDFEDLRIQLISNRNVGGSGGFTKGLIEALQENNYTHFLFMDDDIELDSEAIYRLFALYEYTKQDFAVAGSMLDLNRKHILYEAGAIYNKSINDEGKIKENQYTGYPLKHNLDLLNTTTLNSLLLEDKIDYGGFWFFAFSKKIVSKIGLLLPLFIKIDDMEFGLRINENFENGIITFPSVAVWHEPFYAKRPIWDFYYYVRNHLIANSIHSSLEYIKTVQIFTRCLLYYLFIFDYNSAQMVIKGFEDYMQGPNFITNNDPEILHSKIFEFSRSYKNQTILDNTSLMSEGHPIIKVKIIQKLISLLTLNGHLLPQFLIAEQSIIIRSGMKERESICKGFAKKRIIYIVETSPNAYQYELDQKAGLQILLTWVNSVIKNSFKWSSVKADWKKAFKDFTTIQFWQHYLEPQK